VIFFSVIKQYERAVVAPPSFPSRYSTCDAPMPRQEDLSWHCGAPWVDHIQGSADITGLIVSTLPRPAARKTTRATPNALGRQRITTREMNATRACVCVRVDARRMALAAGGPAAGPSSSGSLR
jgi:hypothetical protein